MLIQIESGDADSPRKVRIEDGDAVHEFTAPNLKEAHKLIAKGRKDGFDADDLAVQTKAETKREVARVEAGKKAAEPAKGAK